MEGEASLRPNLLRPTYSSTPARQALPLSGRTCPPRFALCPAALAGH
jgi:hypothetical protein